MQSHLAGTLRSLGVAVAPGFVVALDEGSPRSSPATSRHFPAPTQRAKVPLTSRVLGGPGAHPRGGVFKGAALQVGVRDTGGVALVSPGAFAANISISEVDQMVDEFTLGGVEARGQWRGGDADAGRNGTEWRQ